MNNCLYLAAMEGAVAKKAAAQELLKALSALGSVGLFRPVIEADHDELVDQLLAEITNDQNYQDAVGLPVDEVMADLNTALATIIEKYGALTQRFDSVLVIGTDYQGVTAPSQLDLNAKLAQNLNAVVVLALANNDQIAAAANHGVAAFAQRNVKVVAVFAQEPVSDLVVPCWNPGNAELATQVAESLKVERKQLRTPRMFEYQIMQKARSNKRTIVLPESEDKRILEAASIILARDVANIVLLGEANEVQAKADELGFDISKAKIQSLTDPELVERFAAKYAELRAKKGVTLEQARQKMTDPSYFGTMMVYLELADGMVSGATHTTANTIRPALEFVKTKPGTKVVSGSFFMCLEDEVLVFADCAVNPNPTPEQLPDIAISTAKTAKAFDIEPKVALLSYSTGTSGAGEDVDAVAEATRLLTEQDPGFGVAGPIQFDAAVDMTVGKQKMPDSDVAGQATVFIFPDLNTGNNTYKAVQRTAGAVAVGPVLQGLNKPVNDLSRGALVADIVNTVAITAIQAATGV